MACVWTGRRVSDARWHEAQPGPVQLFTGTRCTCAEKPCWSRHRREVETTGKFWLTGDRKLGPILRTESYAWTDFWKVSRSDRVPCQQVFQGGCSWVAQTYLGTEMAQETPRVTQQSTPGAARGPAPTPAQTPAAMGCLESSVLLPERLTFCNTL